VSLYRQYEYAKKVETSGIPGLRRCLLSEEKAAERPSLPHVLGGKLPVPPQLPPQVSPQARRRSRVLCGAFFAGRTLRVALCGARSD